MKDMLVFADPVQVELGRWQVELTVPPLHRDLQVSGQGQSKKEAKHNAAETYLSSAEVRSLVMAHEFQDSKPASASSAWKRMKLT